MITKQEREKLISLIENSLVYEGQVALCDHLRRESEEPECVALATYSYNLAVKNADEAGQKLLAYLNELTEESK